MIISCDTDNTHNYHAGILYEGLNRLLRITIILVCYIPSTHGTLCYIVVAHKQWNINNNLQTITGYLTDN